MYICVLDKDVLDCGEEVLTFIERVSRGPVDTANTGESWTLLYSVLLADLCPTDVSGFISSDKVC